MGLADDLSEAVEQSGVDCAGHGLVRGIVARRGGAGEPVVDRFAEAGIRDRLDGDGFGAAAVETLQEGEEIGRSLAQIT